MQYDWALELLIREVVISNPALVPMHILEPDARGSFSRIGLRPTDSPNMGIFFHQRERTRNY